MTQPDLSHIADAARLEPSALRPARRKLFVLWIALLGLTAFAASRSAGTEIRAAYSSLLAFSYFYTIAMGAIFWIMLHHAVDADWSVVVRRQLENITWLFPMLVILFLALIPFHPLLYTWMNPVVAASDHHVHLKEPYLTRGFFYARAAFYGIFFCLIAYVLGSNSRKQDEDGNPARTLRMRYWSVGGLLIFAISLTFSSIDWLMGLDHNWYSTMWGVYIFAGSAQSSLALLVIVIAALLRRGYLKSVVTVEHFHIMGKLLFAFTCFWAYIAFSQYMLIWYANIPEETTFFVKRMQGSWKYLSYFLIAGCFVLPFAMLLGQMPKRGFRYLVVPSAWILIMHYIDLYWIIMPERDPAGIAFHWFDAAYFIFTAALLADLFLGKMSSGPLYPLKDPRLADSVELTN